MHVAIQVVLSQYVSGCVIGIDCHGLWQPGHIYRAHLSRLQASPCQLTFGPSHVQTDGQSHDRPTEQGYSFTFTTKWKIVKDMKRSRAVLPWVGARNGYCCIVLREKL